jgi:hypothetical protein
MLALDVTRRIGEATGSVLRKTTEPKIAAGSPSLAPPDRIRHRASAPDKSGALNIHLEL